MALSARLNRRQRDARIRARHRLGLLLKAVERRQGARTDLKETSGPGVQKFCEAYGITEKPAKEMQRLACLPEPELEKALARAREAGHPISFDERGKAAGPGRGHKGESAKAIGQSAQSFWAAVAVSHAPGAMLGCAGGLSRGVLLRSFPFPSSNLGKDGRVDESDLLSALAPFEPWCRPQISLAFFYPRALGGRPASFFRCLADRALSMGCR